MKKKICLFILISGIHFLYGQNDSISLHIFNGDVVQTGQLEAVGKMLGRRLCTGTLIRDDLVLTAAHCICNEDYPPTACVDRASFTFTNVFRIDDPATLQDESVQRQDVTIAGNVIFHPNYNETGWLNYDYALIHLDRPASSLVQVNPIPVERPENKPQVSDILTIVGYGRTGQGCAIGIDGQKRKAVLEVDNLTNTTIVFNDTQTYACPGDSGGPAINTSGNIVGVASHSNLATNSNYDPTFLAYDWMFEVGKIKAVVGKISFLRIHELGTGYGPATDPLDGEVVVKVNTRSDLSLGLKLREDPQFASHTGMLDLLRHCFNENTPVIIDYRMTGPKHGELIRVAKY